MDSSEQELTVIKRNGIHENVSFDKILKRVKKLGNETTPPLKINYGQLVMKVIDQLYPDIKTHIIDELTAEQCASMCTKHPDYGELASRIIVSNNHKNTLSSFSETMDTLYQFKDIHNKRSSLIHEDLWKISQKYKDEIEKEIDYNRDYFIDYFGFKTLERAYLMKIDNKIIERPQHMWMRVAIGIHGDDLESAFETYFLMSNKFFTHATPTLFNAGTPRPQLSSCYLIGMEDDSIDGIYNTLKDCAKISKWAGGIGLHIHNVRATGSHIRGTNGNSNGIVPMLSVFNETARYVDQGGGKRNGSFAIYIEPWHADIQDFLDLKLNHGDEQMRARDLFYALWIPSLFMEKVKANQDWSLFCPDSCPGLSNCYGEDFNKLYETCCNEGKAIKTIKARDLWYQILDSQMETGTPYLLYKDPANAKSNQKNLGVIKSSNLCSEIIEYSDSNQTAVCNLASIGLSKFVKILGDTNKPILGDTNKPILGDTNKPIFDYDYLHHVTKVVTRNLNKIIDVNFYPTQKTRISNLLHRPIGIGVQGLADAFILLDVAYHSEEAKEINKLIFETMYHASLECSNEIAMERKNMMNKIHSYHIDDYNIFAENNVIQNDYSVCREYKTNNDITKELEFCQPIPPEIKLGNTDYAGAYSSFMGSPISNGEFQFDMWGVKPSSRYNWQELREKITKYGLRNSLLLAPMPTASTSQILGNNECFEPFTSNIYTRRTLAGEFVMVNKYLMRELIDLGIWSNTIKDSIIVNKGSIQHIEGLSDKIKEKYKIVWEIPMKHMIDMSADRGAFICQSQSLNLWMEDPDYKSLTSMHFYAWQKGLKTGIYYLRRKPKHQPQQFTIDPNRTNEIIETEPEICDMCSG